jgi:TonB family protein
MTAISRALTSALLHFVWQGVVVAALLWITLFVLRKRSANARYAASCLALAVLAMAPVVTAIVSYESVQLAPYAGPPVSDTSFVRLASNEVVRTTSWLISARQAQAWILTVWSAGVLVFSLRLLWSCRYIYVIRRRAAAAERTLLDVVNGLSRRMGITSKVDVLMSSIADGPSAVGWLRPVILLPASSLLGLSSQQLEAVIAHELAHIRRHDYIVSAVQVIVETLLFYHPAVWWTSSRIRHERELCCDDLAIRACGDAICYARALTQLEKLRVVKPSLVLGGTDGGLLYRIQRIIGEKTMEYGPSKLSGVLVLFLALAGLGLNLTWMRAEAQSPEQAQITAEAKLQSSNVIRDQNNGVSVNLGSTSIIHRTDVDYPEAAVKQGIQGTVSVEVTLDSTGNVADAKVLSGPTELRKAALQSVLQWHFAPDGAQGARVVHLVFDLDAAKKAMEGRTFRLRLADGRAFTGVIGSDEARAKEEEKVRDRLTTGYAIEAVQREALVKQKLEENLLQGAPTAQSEEFALKQERMKKMIDEIKAEMPNADPGQRAEMEKKVAELKSEIPAAEAGQQRELNKEMARRREVEMSAVKRIAIAGRTLSAIRVEGLSDESRQALVSRLPVRVGDTLTAESLETISKTIREFDEHLEHGFSLSEDKNGLDLRIVAPGSHKELEPVTVRPSTRRP